MPHSVILPELERGASPVIGMSDPIGRPCAEILGVKVDAIDLEQAMQMIDAQLRRGVKGYVCAVGVHGILEALRNSAVADALGHAAISIPDGTPTVWIGRAQGWNQMDHVTGPEVMQEVFRRPEFATYTHFFYGGKPGVATELRRALVDRFPHANVVGSYTPPFRDLTQAEEDDLIKSINKCKPDIVWVGIGTPRQDVLMRRLLPFLEVRLMFGVGAAFDFLTGRISLCPLWVKRAGLHWLHRLVQDPKRLWRRNLGNTAFLWHIALQFLGWRDYPVLTADDRDV